MILTNLIQSSSQTNAQMATITTDDNNLLKINPILWPNQWENNTLPITIIKNGTFKDICTEANRVSSYRDQNSNLYNFYEYSQGVGSFLFKSTFNGETLMVFLDKDTIILQINNTTSFFFTISDFIMQFTKYEMDLTKGLLFSPNEKSNGNNFFIINSLNGLSTTKLWFTMDSIFVTFQMNNSGGYKCLEIRKSILDKSVSFVLIDSDGSGMNLKFQKKNPFESLSIEVKTLESMRNYTLLAPECLYLEDKIYSFYSESVQLLKSSYIFEQKSNMIVNNDYKKILLINNSNLTEPISGSATNVNNFLKVSSYKFSNSFCEIYTKIYEKNFVEISYIDLMKNEDYKIIFTSNFFSIESKIDRSIVYFEEGKFLWKSFVNSFNMIKESFSAIVVDENVSFRCTNNEVFIKINSMVIGVEFDALSNNFLNFFIGPKLDDYGIMSLFIDENNLINGISHTSNLNLMENESIFYNQGVDEFADFLLSNFDFPENINLIAYNNNDINMHIELFRIPKLSKDIYGLSFSRDNFKIIINNNIAMIQNGQNLYIINSNLLCYKYIIEDDFKTIKIEQVLFSDIIAEYTEFSLILNYNGSFFFNINNLSIRKEKDTNFVVLYEATFASLSTVFEQSILSSFFKINLSNNELQLIDNYTNSIGSFNINNSCLFSLNNLSSLEINSGSSILTCAINRLFIYNKNHINFLYMKEEKIIFSDQEECLMEIKINDIKTLLLFSHNSLYFIPLTSSDLLLNRIYTYTLSDITIHLNFIEILQYLKDNPSAMPNFSINNFTLPSVDFLFSPHRSFFVYNDMQIVLIENQLSICNLYKDDQNKIINNFYNPIIFKEEKYKVITLLDKNTIIPQIIHYGNNSISIYVSNNLIDIICENSKDLSLNFTFSITIDKEVLHECFSYEDINGSLVNLDNQYTFDILSMCIYNEQNSNYVNFVEGLNGFVRARINYSRIIYFNYYLENNNKQITVFIYYDDIQLKLIKDIGLPIVITYEVTQSIGKILNITSKLLQQLSFHLSSYKENVTIKTPLIHVIEDYKENVFISNDPININDNSFILERIFNKGEANSLLSNEEKDITIDGVDFKITTHSYVKSDEFIFSQITLKYNDLISTDIYVSDDTLLVRDSNKNLYIYFQETIYILEENIWRETLDLHYNNGFPVLLEKQMLLDITICPEIRFLRDQQANFGFYIGEQMVFLTNYKINELSIDIKCLWKSIAYDINALHPLLINYGITPIEDKFITLTPLLIDNFISDNIFYISQFSSGIQTINTLFPEERNRISFKSPKHFLEFYKNFKILVGALVEYDAKGERKRIFRFNTDGEFIITSLDGSSFSLQYINNSLNFYRINPNQHSSLDQIEEFIIDGNKITIDNNFVFYFTINEDKVYLTSVFLINEIDISKISIQPGLLTTSRQLSDWTLEFSSMDKFNDFSLITDKESYPFSDTIIGNLLKTNEENKISFDYVVESHIIVQTSSTEFLINDNIGVDKKLKFQVGNLSITGSIYKLNIDGFPMAEIILDLYFQDFRLIISRDVTILFANNRIFFCKHNFELTYELDSTINRFFNPIQLQEDIENWSFILGLDNDNNFLFPGSLGKSIISATFPSFGTNNGLLIYEFTVGNDTFQLYIDFFNEIITISDSSLASN